MSENYVTRRQSLKLLGEILLDRANFDIMMKYIGCGHDTKTTLEAGGVLGTQLAG